VRTCWGTHWELIGNIVRTYWEPGKMGKQKKSFLHPPPQNFKGKKARHLECMLGPSNWLHEISLPKRVHHHFWPGLIALANYVFNFIYMGVELWPNHMGKKRV